MESHNYEPDESEVWRSYTHETNRANRGQWWTTGKKRSVKRWVVTLVVGIIQGSIAYFCNMLTRSLSGVKWDHVYEVLQQERTGETWTGKAYFIFLFYQTLFVSVAFLMVYIEPVSAGSGIPEVKVRLSEGLESEATTVYIRQPLINSPSRALVLITVFPERNCDPPHRSRQDPLLQGIRSNILRGRWTPRGEGGPHGP